MLAGLSRRHRDLGDELANSSPPTPRTGSARSGWREPERQKGGGLSWAPGLARAEHSAKNTPPSGIRRSRQGPTAAVPSACLPNSRHVDSPGQDLQGREIVGTERESCLRLVFISPHLLSRLPCVQASRLQICAKYHPSGTYFLAGQALVSPLAISPPRQTTQKQED